MGSSMSGRFLMGAALGGPMGAIMQASAPSDFARVNPIMPVNPMATGSIGGFAGAAVGGLAGLKRSPRAAIAGTIMGGVSGAFVGGVAAPATQLMGFVGANRNFYAQSPYANRSSATAAALNASGDIVLGMHNARGGY